jgi:hypothetical protein
MIKPRGVIGLRSVIVSWRGVPWATMDKAFCDQVYGLKPPVDGLAAPAGGDVPQLQFPISGTVSWEMGKMEPPRREGAKP